MTNGGHARLVLLPLANLALCRAGACWAQEHVLRSHPKSDVRVFVAWMQILPGDTNTQVAGLRSWTTPRALLSICLGRAAHGRLAMAVTRARGTMLPRVWA